MKFVDQATIRVKAGDGGAGCVSFRREKYVPRGGPDGGDGGRGGHIILSASSPKNTLYRFHFNQYFRAENGKPGQGKNKHGADGADRIIELPLGTNVLNVETGEVLADLTEPGQKFVAAKGGSGGFGNAHYVSSTNRAPRQAQTGQLGQEVKLFLELKLLADVGLVGLPNVGKSTLISRMSAARPKIADYPFTTLIPILGLVALDEDNSFVLADLPGLIEGASQGSGLGLRFLKHIQRCGVLVHLLDAGRVNLQKPLADLNTIKTELEAFDPALMSKKQLVVINKMDLTGADQVLDLVRRSLPGGKVLGISAVTGQGLDELKWTLFNLLKETD